MILAFASVLTIMSGAQQWVTFIVKPKNVILTIDETRMVLGDGSAKLLLEPGLHRYSVESPYFETLTDTFNLNDTVRSDVFVVMQPAYSYLNVVTRHNNAGIYVDRKKMGVMKAATSKITAGVHRLTVIADTMCLFDGKVILDKGEKKTVDVEKMNTTPFKWSVERWLLPLSALDEDGALDSAMVSLMDSVVELEQCGVNVTSNVAGADIFIDGKMVGTTPLVIQRLVAGRKYMVTLKKEGYRVTRTTFAAESGNVARVNVKMKRKR